MTATEYFVIVSVSKYFCPDMYSTVCAGAGAGAGVCIHVCVCVCVCALKLHNCGMHVNMCADALL